METLPKDKATDGPNPVPAGAPGRAATAVLGWIEGVSIMVTKPQNASGRLRLPAVISAAGTTVGQGNIVNIGTTGALIETVEALD